MKLEITNDTVFNSITKIGEYHPPPPTPHPPHLWKGVVSKFNYYLKGLV
jgi:hypothetical protein